MNLGNVMYYMWGYREVPVPEYDPCGCCSKGVSDIGGLEYDPKTSMLSMSFVRDGQMEEIQTKIALQPSAGCITEISSMKLNKDNTLTLTYMKDNEKKEVSVNLNSLEDDIFIEDLGGNSI